MFAVDFVCVCVCVCVCVYWINALYQAEEVPLYFYFSKSIIHEWMSNFVKCLFLCWFMNSCAFLLQFVNWYIISIDLMILKNPCILGIQPISLWCIISLMYCWGWFASVCWGFLHLCSLVINWFVIFFFSGTFGFSIRVMVDS